MQTGTKQDLIYGLHNGQNEQKDILDVLEPEHH